MAKNYHDKWLQEKTVCDAHVDFFWRCGRLRTEPRDSGLLRKHSIIEFYLQFYRRLFLLKKKKITSYPVEERAGKGNLLVSRCISRPQVFMSEE